MLVIELEVIKTLSDNPDIKGIILDSIGGWIYEGRELSKIRRIQLISATLWFKK